MTDALVALLVLSAACELYGTATVALSYWRGHTLATGVLAAIDGSELPPGLRMLRMDDGLLANIGVDEARANIRTLAEQALGRRYLTAGLIAYALGAVAGLAAGLLAVAR